jgi:hypothetical protein
MRTPLASFNGTLPPVWAANANAEKMRNTITAMAAIGIRNLVIFINISPDYQVINSTKKRLLTVCLLKYHSDAKI